MLADFSVATQYANYDDSARKQLEAALNTVKGTGGLMRDDSRCWGQHKRHTVYTVRQSTDFVNDCHFRDGSINLIHINLDILCEQRPRVVCDNNDPLDILRVSMKQMPWRGYLDDSCSLRKRASLVASSPANIQPGSA